MSTESVPPLVFCVLGPPVAKERPRVVVHNGRPHAYTPSRTVNYELLVGNVALTHIAKRYHQLRAVSPETPASAHTWPMDRFYRLTVDFYSATRVRADLDNYAKAIFDGLNAIAYSDDWRVLSLHAERYCDRLRPRAEIRVDVIPSRFTDEPSLRRRKPKPVSP